MQCGAEGEQNLKHETLTCFGKGEAQICSGTNGIHNGGIELGKLVPRNSYMMEVVTAALGRSQSFKPIHLGREHREDSTHGSHLSRAQFVQ